MDSKLAKNLPNIFLAIGSTIFVLILCEISIRIYHSQLLVWKNLLKENVDLNRSAYPSIYHPELGWIPSTEITDKKNIWSTQVNILRHGIRSNGNVKMDTIFNKKSILVVGDSFTFGDEVSDHETWPAQLETKTGKKVINAGVFGYGLDQIILRAESLLPIYKPDTVIVAFVPDDIRRCILSVRTGVPKPYFLLENGELALKNIPVPLRPANLGGMDFFRKFFGYSALINALMRRINANYWMLGTFSESISTNQDELKIACHLFKRLAETGRTSNLKIIIVILYYSDMNSDDLLIRSNILSCILENKLAVLDLYDPLNDLRINHPDYFNKLYLNHFSPEGNSWVSQIVFDFMKYRMN